MLVRLWARRDHDQAKQGDTADDEDVGDVPDEEVTVGDEVGDMPLPERRRVHDPVDEVADRAAEDQAQCDAPTGATQSHCESNCYCGGEDADDGEHLTAIHSELLPTKNDHAVFKSSATTMQIVSYLTAAEILGGRAFWFGFPRPDRSGMLTAIQTLVQAMGTGIAPDTRPTGLSAHAADGTVDIVAWRSFLDGQPASIVAYGQVASGSNWKSKPIKSFIDGHFLPWFVKSPSHKHIEMLFVPILQHQELGESKKEDFRFVATEQARLRENDFGIVIDRLRLTELMASSKTNGRYETAEYAQHEATTLAWLEAASAYASGTDAAA